VTLNQLECFMVLAQRLNFTQAADDLFMAQPALSRLISALEKELDLQLFYRNSRSVALTPAGTVFFKKCPKILDEYRGSVVAGWASTVCIVCFMGGVQLICLGVIGEYIGKIYMETKARPRYIISERTWAPYERKYHG